MPDKVAAQEAVAALGDRSALVLQGILSISSEAIITADADRRIMTFSPGAEHMFGYAAAAVIGKPIEFLMPERFRTRHGVHVQRFAAGPRSSALMRDRQPIFGLRSSGEEFPIEASISRVQTREGLIFTTIIRDVTEQRRDEERLARSEQRLRMATANSDLHVFELDYQAKVLVKSGAEDSFFDRPLVFQDLAENPLSCVDPRDYEEVQRAWIAHDGQSPFRAECRLARSDGREVWAQLSAQLVCDANGNPQRWVGALQNITARKQAEAETAAALAAARAADQAKSAFLATMSHEIRTPLNGVLGMAQAMSFDELLPPQRRKLQIIQESGENLLAILNDILDLSKIEAGRLEIETVAFEFGSLLAGAQAAFSALAAKKGVALVVDGAAADGRYAGDPTRLRQILFNFISNALKFTETGEVRATARHDGETLTLEVSDTGIGMSQQVLEEIFRPFSQADASTTREYGGTGLGLTICQRLANLMGGEIGVTSTPGTGSTFTLRLPLPRCELAERASGPARPDATAELGELPLRVLAAEDNPTNQLVLRTLLTQVGVDVVMVSNGEEAKAAWENGAFDVILMDVQMPVLDGVSAARAIREGERMKGRPRTPIIALTANAMAHQAAEYLAAGMDATVTKPLDVKQLFASMQAVTAQAGEFAPPRARAAGSPHPGEPS